MSKAFGTTISANTMRLGLGLNPAPPAKHRLKVNSIPGSDVLLFKCANCGLTLSIFRRVVHTLLLERKFVLATPYLFKSSICRGVDPRAPRPPTTQS